jgi:hypothetical protein
LHPGAGGKTRQVRLKQENRDLLSALTRPFAAARYRWAARVYFALDLVVLAIAV